MPPKSKIQEPTKPKKFVLLMGFGGCSAALHPMHVALGGTDFFGEITQSFEISVNRARVVERAKGHLCGRAGA